jgi:hypothetical protein
MDINQIKQLLIKYFDGVTTLEEERMLRRYFTEENEIPGELDTYRQQFLLISETSNEKPDTSELELRISEQIENQAIALQPASYQKRLYRYLAAASVAVLIGVSGFLIYQNLKPGAKDTYTDPKLAYNEAQKALLYVSQKMNKGIEPLSNVSKITAGTDKLKSLEKMDESMGMLNLVSIINRSSNLKK